jgi:hypothetical protein
MRFRRSRPRFPNRDAPAPDGARHVGHILREERLHYQGPLPRPEDFAAYERVLRGAADRILKMAENQAAHAKAWNAARSRVTS